MIPTMDAKDEELGRLVSAERRKLGLTQVEFAVKAKISLPTLQNIESVKNGTRTSRTLRNLAVFLGRDIEAFIKDFANAGDSDSDAAPAGIVPGSLKEVIDIDHHDGVSAARSDDRDADEPGKIGVPVGGRDRFAATIDGDCMEPKYHNGDVVVFSVQAYQQEGIIDGRNYFVQLKDGSNTFKRIRLDPENRDRLRLVPLNEKYKVLEVSRGEVQFIARAMYRLDMDGG